MCKRRQSVVSDQKLSELHSFLDGLASTSGQSRLVRWSRMNRVFLAFALAVLMTDRRCRPRANQMWNARLKLSQQDTQIGVYLNVLRLQFGRSGIRLATPPAPERLIVKTAKVKAPTTRHAWRSRCRPTSHSTSHRRNSWGDDVLTIEVKYAGTQRKSRNHRECGWRRGATKDLAVAGSLRRQI